MRLPPPLAPGACIGLAAPSGPVPGRELQEAVHYLEQRGYSTAVGAHALQRDAQFGYLAGTDHERAHDLQQLWLNPQVDALFCLRGGYGAMRLLPLLDVQAMQRVTKPFLGYSDITTLHLLLNGGGLATYYGPNAGGLQRLNAAASACLWGMLEQTMQGVLPAEPESMQTLQGGSTEGRLAGGCLCLLAHACGTPLQPNLDGCIVALEDVGEPLYRIDRFITQLLLSGVLQNAAGFVAGTVTRWENEEASPRPDNLLQLWLDRLGPLNKPILAGFPFGHEPDPLTIPLGRRAALNADARSLTLLPD